MNNKKKLIRIWSCILIATIIINIIFFAIIGKNINSEVLWVAEIIIIHFLIVWDVVVLFFWIMCFSIKYKKLTIENNEIEVYAGFRNHYILVNGEMKDEYIASLSFSPINLSCTIEKRKISVVISTSNHITIKCDEKLVK